MKIHCGLLLIFLSCVRTKDYVYDYDNSNAVTEIKQRYAFWPSMHNAFKLKREVQPSINVQSEGGNEVASLSVTSTRVTPASAEPKEVEPKNQQAKEVNPPEKPDQTKSILPVTHDTNSTLLAPSTNETSVNATSLIAVPKTLDLKNPNVLMRGVIVFGGFLILAVLYYIFYKTKGNKNDTGSAHNTNDANQFRYGVLNSEDQRDNLELSRVPLTMESDDDEDEDLEIFDLGQKKKSLSYVNLQTNDEDIVFPKNIEQGNSDNLLLDIEDVSTDPLINWSNNANNKSIL